MKQKSFALIASALLLFACEDYNEANFEGYKDKAEPTDVKTLSYTLKTADYATIFKSSANLALAIQMGTDEDGVIDSSYYMALKSNQSKAYFTDKVPASKYIPAFLESQWFTATDGSALKITYNKLVDEPELNQKIQSATKYTLTDADYATAWSDGEGYTYFTPSKAPASYMNRILKSAVTNPATGDCAWVTYNYSATEPSTGSGEEEEKFDKISDLVDAGIAGTGKVKATVVGTYGRGFLIDDGTATMLVYLGVPGNFTVGDVVIVEGATSVYGGFAQFTKEATLTKVENTAFEYPTPKVLTAAEMDAYLTAPTIQYVKYQGKLSISGNYYNVAIEGAQTAIGSIQYAYPGTVTADMDGKDVEIVGYAIGISGGKYFNTMATSVALVDADLTYDPIGVVLRKSVGSYDVKGAIVASYARGYLVSDGTGAILYYNKDYAGTDSIGDVVTLSGSISEFSGLKQYSANATVNQLEKKKTITYPTARVLSGADMDALLVAPCVEYVSYTGTLSISGSYYNVTIADANTAVGSLSFLIDGAVDPALDGKKIVVTGYFIGVSSGKYFNTMVTKVVEAPAAAAPMRAKGNDAETRFAVYQWNGSAWTAPADVAVIQPSDYSAMGLSNNALSAPATYLPLYLVANYPYALAKDEVTVAYFNSSSSINADVYVFDGKVWSTNHNLETCTDQFVRNNGVWNYDPSVVVTLLPVKGNATSVAWYQAIADYVAATYGSEYYQTGYTNAEYYYGTSAYYCNITFVQSKWRTDNKAAAYDEYDDKSLEELQYERLKECFIPALKKFYPDAVPVEGIEVTYTVHFGLYTGTTLSAPNYTVVYKVTAPGTFEFLRQGAIQ